MAITEEKKDRLREIITQTIMEIQHRAQAEEIPLIEVFDKILAAGMFGLSQSATTKKELEYLIDYITAQVERMGTLRRLELQGEAAT